jgi:hypothetical protein
MKIALSFFCVRITNLPKNNDIRLLFFVLNFFNSQCSEQKKIHILENVFILFLKCIKNCFKLEQYFIK